MYKLLEVYMKLELQQLVTHRTVNGKKNSRDLVFFLEESANNRHVAHPFLESCLSSSESAIKVLCKCVFSSVKAAVILTHTF